MEKYIFLALYAFGFFLYWILNRRTNGSNDLRGRLDRWIPFIPEFIIPYLSVFAFVPIAIILLFNTSVAIPYFLALTIAMYGALIVWYFFPARMYAPHILGKSFSERMTALWYRHDPHANGFPSSHVINATITSFYASLAFPQFSLLIWTIGVLVVFSTLFIKHHRIWDVIAGALWATTVIIIVGYLG